MKRGFLLSLLPLTALAIPDQPPPLKPAEVAHFNKDVLPILKNRCYECHSHEAGKIKGGLTVDSRDGLIKGGDSGAAVVPGNLKDSLLVTSVVWEDPDFQMPPKHKMPDAEIKALVDWVKEGAPDPRASMAPSGGQAAIQEKAKTHWALQPLAQPVIPTVKDKSWPKNPVDAFILAKLEEKGMKPSPQADKLTLLRRVSYDLTGLPPSTEDTNAFLADKSPDAYTKLVDRLLASPHYGERWARYWLDVARYADTTGEAGVGGRDNRFIYGWTYRDYVVRAFNEDKPYNQFVQEQLAADQLVAQGKADRRNLAAMGFITIGKRFTNNDDVIDDRIDATGRAFMGLTVSCARCHDHKFDPITTEDYYSWHGIFSSTREPEQGPLLDEPRQTPEYADFEKQVADALLKVDETTDNEWEDHFNEQFGKMATYLMAIHDAEKGTGGLSVNTFYRSRGLTQGIAQRWAAYLKGTAARGATAAKRSTPTPDFDPIFAPWKALAALPDADFEVKAPEALAKAMAGEGDKKVNPLIAQLFADPPKSLKDAADRYGKLFTDIQKQHHEKRAELLKAAGTWKQIAITLDTPDADAIHRILYGPDAPADRAKLTLGGELGVSSTTKQQRMITKVNDIRLNHPASPARAMAMEDVEKPRNSRIFIRGDRNKQGPEVPRRFLSILGGEKPFTVGSGRLELAEAITDPKNPLTARVIINRVWMHHFGQGLVTTPSDFGLRGDPPSHPEMLDFLCRQFMDNHWSLKKLHRLIVTSATYQQRSDDVPQYRELNPTNSLVWKMNRRRLDVESLRDTLLTASGTLEGTVGGRPVDLLGNDQRRTIYAFINRENIPGVLANFDFALPEMSSPQRNESTVPTQALFMMNSPFVIDQARKLAALPQVVKASSDDQRVRQLYARLFQRAPDKADLSDALTFIREQNAFKPEPPPKSDWKYGMGVINPGKPMYLAEAKNFRDNQWVIYDKKQPVKVGETGGLTGATAASVRRWVAPADGTISIDGALSATGKTSKGLVARVELRRGNQPPTPIANWKAGKDTVATTVETIEVKTGDALDFIVLPAGGAPESYAWAPSIHLRNASGEMPDKHDWDARSEFAGPPPAPPKGMTPWEKYAQALLLANEFVYLN